MKRLIQIMLLLLLINGAIYGQEKNDCVMNISLWDKSPKQNIKLSITSPEGTVIWFTDSKTNKVLDSDTDIIRITVNNWFSLPGIYNINVELADKLPENKMNSSMEFEMNGKEINLQTRIYLYFIAEHPTLARAFFHIEKSYNSSDSVILIERWKPTPNGKPTFTIINNSSVKIYDTYRNNFYGYIMKFGMGKWEVYEPKDDLNYIYGNPLQSGDSIITVEKPFLGKGKEFTSGRYKYCVHYTNSDYDFALFRSRAQNNVLDIYLLEKEFTIDEE